MRALICRRGRKGLTQVKIRGILRENFGKISHVRFHGEKEGMKMKLVHFGEGLVNIPLLLSDAESGDGDSSAIGSEVAVDENLVIGIADDNFQEFRDLFIGGAADDAGG